MHSWHSIGTCQEQRARVVTNKHAHDGLTVLQGMLNLLTRPPVFQVSAILPLLSEWVLSIIATITTHMHVAAASQQSGNYPTFSLKVIASVTMSLP